MIVPLGRNQARLISVVRETDNEPHLFGGAAPMDLTPRDQTSRYLLSLELEQNRFISIFLKDDPGTFINRPRTIIGEADGAFEVLAHSQLARRDDSKFHSTFPAMALRLGPLRNDKHHVDGDMIRPDGRNKLGGGTYLIEENPPDLQLVSTIEEMGFTQLLQLDGSTLGPFEGSPPYSLPYGFGIFHLYLRPGQSGHEWCCFVDQ